MTRKAADEEAQLSLLTGPRTAAQTAIDRPADPPPPIPELPRPPVPPPELPPPPAAPRIFSVTEILRSARVMLESRFTDVRVEGEISGLKRSGPGHLYFCLKDQEAQLDCVLFSREAARLRFALEEGMAVRCRGRLTL